MPSVFAGLEDELSTAVDETFGESFVFLPMTQPTVNSRLGPDPTRLSFEFTAVIDNKSAGSNSFERLGKSSGGVASKGGTPQFVTSSPMMFFDSRQFVGAGLPRRLDRVRRADTGEVFEVTAIEQDGLGRHKASIVKVAQD
jgi:hypothetical protein